MRDGIEPAAGSGGFPQALVEIADQLRRPGFGIPACVALQIATTAYSYAQVTREPSGELLQLWGAAAVILISFSFTWRGLRPTPDRLFIGNLLLQFAAFELGVVLTGHSPLAASTVFVGNLVQAVIAALIYRRFIGRDNWAPRSPVEVGILLLASMVGAVVSTPFGAWPGLGIDQMWSELAFWWIVRGSVDLAIGALPALLVCHSQAGGHLRVPWPWFQVLLLPALYGANRVMFHWSHLPLAWPVILCAVWAGLALTPRLAGIFALISSGVTAGVGALEGRPWNREDVTGTGLVVDLLSLICVFLIVLLPLVRAQRGRMQARVAAHWSLLSTVFDTMGDGVLVYNPDGSVALSNERAVELLGRPVPRAPVRLADHFELTEVDGSPLTAEHETSLLVTAAGGPAELDVAAHPPGTSAVKYLRLNVRRFAPDDPRTVILISDISERRMRQRELMKFAGRVAHDLRNPMTSAQLWLEAVQEALDDDEPMMARGRVARADQALQRLNQVVNGWLIYSISRDGALDPGPCRIDDLAQELLSALAPSEVVAEPEFVIEAPHPVDGDERLVRELLGNLIGNALKYGADGDRARVEITTHPVGPSANGVAPQVDTRPRDRAARPMVEVAVRDHGPGVARGEEERIFEEFHRGADVPDTVRGSGMGLATSKMIVERHGGSIRAERADGGGTRIVFTLPAA